MSHNSFSMLSVITISLLLLGGCNSSSNDTEVSKEATTQINGLAIDGYIQGATVCADLNGDGVCGIGEPSAVTDAQGNFTLSGSGIEGVPLVLTGGVDTGTGLPFEGSLHAPAGSTKVTPLTSAIQAMAESSGTTPAQAEAKLKEQLGISADVDLTDFDPIAAVEAGGAGAEAAQRVLAIQTQVQVLAQSVGNAVAGASDSVDTGAAMAEAMKQIAERIAAGEDISDPEVIKKVVKQTADKALAGDEDAKVKVEAVSDAVAEKSSEAANKAVEAIEKAVGSDAIDSMNAAISVSQKELGDALEEAVKSAENDGLDDVVVDDLVEKAKEELPHSSSSEADSSEAQSSSSAADSSESQSSESSSVVSSASSSSIPTYTPPTYVPPVYIPPAVSSSSQAASSSSLASNAISLPFSWGDLWTEHNRCEINTHENFTDINGFQSEVEMNFNGTIFENDSNYNGASVFLEGNSWVETTSRPATLNADATELTIPYYNAVFRIVNPEPLNGPVYVDGIGDITFSAGSERFNLQYRIISDNYSLRDVENDGEYHTLEEFIVGQSDGRWFNDIETGQHISFEAGFQSGDTTGNIEGFYDDSRDIRSIVGTWEIKPIGSSSLLGIFLSVNDERMDARFYTEYDGKIYSGQVDSVTGWQEDSEPKYNLQAMNEIRAGVVSGTSECQQQSSSQQSSSEGSSSSSSEGSASSSSSEGSSSSSSSNMVDLVGHTYYLLGLNSNFDGSTGCMARFSFETDRMKIEYMEDGHLQTEIRIEDHPYSVEAIELNPGYFKIQGNAQDQNGYEFELYFDNYDDVKAYIVANSLNDCSHYYPDPAIAVPVPTLDMEPIANIEKPVDFASFNVPVTVYDPSGNALTLEVDGGVPPGVEEPFIFTPQWANSVVAGVHDLLFDSIPTVTGEMWLTAKVQNTNATAIQNQNVTVRSSFRVKVGDGTPTDIPQEEVTFSGHINFVDFDGNSVAVPENAKIHIRPSQDNWDNTVVITINSNGDYSKTVTLDAGVYNDGDDHILTVFGDINTNDNWDGDSGQIHPDGTVENDIRYLDTMANSLMSSQIVNLPQVVNLFGLKFQSQDNIVRMEDDNGVLKLTGYSLSGPADPAHDFIHIVNTNAVVLEANVTFEPDALSGDYPNALDIRIPFERIVGQETIYTETSFGIGGNQGNFSIGGYVDFRDGSPRSDYLMHDESFDYSIEHKFTIYVTNTDHIWFMIDDTIVHDVIIPPYDSLNFLESVISLQGKGVAYISNVTVIE